MGREVNSMWCLPVLRESRNPYYKESCEAGDAHYNGLPNGGKRAHNPQGRGNMTLLLLFGDSGLSLITHKTNPVRDKSREIKNEMMGSSAETE